jgi:hypothetical protein
MTVRRRDVSAVHGMHPWKSAIKSTIGGKMLAAVWRQRRAPAAAAVAAGRARAAGAPPRPARVRRAYRAVFVVPCGPGELERLSDTLASIEHYEGDEAKCIILDDATPDVRWPEVAARHPTADVIHLRWPSGGPPRQSPGLTRVFATALARYDFDVLCKLDSDALVTGSGLTERAREIFEAQPRTGLLGTVGMRADGEPEDYTYDAWVLGHERRWSRAVSDVMRRAERGAYRGARVHGGVYLSSRRALAAVAAAGDLRRSPPWWSQIPEDMWYSLCVCAAGFGVRSWGAPGEPTASASRFLPVALGDVEPRGVLAVHSVRRGLHGESEDMVRAHFLARRIGGRERTAPGRVA